MPPSGEFLSLATRKRLLQCSLLAGACFFSEMAAAESSLRAARTLNPPNLDGRLDDAVWKNAPSSVAFTQKFPTAGSPPTEPTAVRVLYDDHALYIGIDCTQRLAPVVQRLSRRDRAVEADTLTVSLDTRRDRTTAFEFSVNAAGVLGDSIRYNDTDVSEDWDEIWDARAAKTASGWSAELMIPLRVLRFDQLPIQDWGLQIRRYVSQRQETDEWAFIPRDAAGEVSRYGRLVGLERLRHGGRLELRPSLALRLRWLDGDPAGTQPSFGWAMGLDLKLRLTQNLIFDLALNPDFGQVEADQVVLNLTNYETFYPEKRPFFLEGIDTLRTPLQLFYTRRVGRAPVAPSLRSEAPHRESPLKEPEPTTIYAAGKLLGTLGRRLTIGAFSALSDKNQIPIQTAAQRPEFRVAEPLKIQSVLRLKLALGSNAHIGFVGTALAHFEQAGDAPLLGGAASGSAEKWCASGEAVAAQSSCFHDAYVAALDGRWRSRGGDYVLNAQLLLSAISGGPPRQLSDGTRVGSGDIDTGAYLQFAKEGGEHFLFNVDAQVFGRRLDFNDLGYMRRQNEIRLSASVEYRTLKPWWKTLETHTFFDFGERENLNGLNLARSFQLGSFWILRNFWRIYATTYYRGAYFDDREVGDGTALERADVAGLDLSVASDSRRRVSGELWVQGQRTGSGYNFAAEGTLTLRPVSSLELQLLPQMYFSFGEPRYIGSGSQENELHLGRLQASSIGATARATYAFTTRLTVQVYGQLLLAVRHYDSFFSYRRPLDEARPAIRLSELMPAAAPRENPDSSDPVLNVSAILRWEYLPGSALFVVYSRSQGATGTYQPGGAAVLDLGILSRRTGSEALLLKWSHWYG